MITKVKICCISSIAEADMAVRLGASALGLVGKMPGGPGIISDDEIREIAATVPPAVSTFMLTSETDANEIIRHQKRTFTTSIQIVDALSIGDHTMIRTALPGIKIIQVIHVLDERSLDEALAIAGFVDAILLDSGNPNLQIKELGGTGRLHNWKISRRIVEQSGIPVFLAGGLTPDNVRQAIDEVQPFGVDVCTGVRTNGKLDEVKLASFITQILKA